MDSKHQVASTPQPRKTDDSTLPDAWDYKGRPAVRSKTGGWISAAMILGVETCERLTTLGIAVNLVTYLTGTMHMGSAASANIVTNFLGTSFMLCLLGGFVADTFLGRYLTIAIFTTVQATGVAILTISTIIPTLHPPKCDMHGDLCIPANTLQLSILFISLYLTALGTGGLKSSVSGFGSDQFDETNPEEKAQMIGFFNWFFFFISIGSLVAVTILVYIQDNQGRDWGYGVCACAIVIGLIVFLCGTRKYRYKKLVGSPLTQIAAVLVGAWRKRHMKSPFDMSGFFTIDELKSDVKRKPKLPRSKQFRFLDKAAIKEPGKNHAELTKWQISTVTDVEEVKMVIRMLPIWATTIIFWTVYAQMTTFSVSQATTMDRRIGPHFHIPAASLTAFFVGGILLTVPFYDYIVNPIAKAVMNPQGLSPLQRVGVGLVLSVLAMVAAALVEVKRLGVAKAHGFVNSRGQLPMSVFWLAPQFLLVGSGEAFTYIGQLDFFLRECPEGMKTMSTGLFLSTLSIGCFFSSMLVAIVHKVTQKNPWLANNLNQGKLQNFYWLLAGLSLINFVLYLACSKWYVYKDKTVDDDHVELEEAQAATYQV